MIELNKKARWCHWEKARLYYTKQFVGNVKGNILDIGEPNEFCIRMGYPIVTNTSGNLDEPYWKPEQYITFDVIFCFHVIEHLINPLLFLQNLRKRCDSNTRIFITYPVGKYWYKCHWHQIDKERFMYLLDIAGYKIVRYKRQFLWKNWKYIFFRLRPFLRHVVFGQRYEFYECKI